eukprot:scaffold219418_cov32-Tisochrysis_lutea.AAC.1
MIHKLVKFKVIRSWPDGGAHTANRRAPCSIPVDANTLATAAVARGSAARDRILRVHKLEENIDVSEPTRVGSNGRHHLVKLHVCGTEELALPIGVLAAPTDREQRTLAAKHHRARAHQFVSNPDAAIEIRVAALNQLRDDHALGGAGLDLLEADAQWLLETHAEYAGCAQNRAFERGQQQRDHRESPRRHRGLRTGSSRELNE